MGNENQSSGFDFDAIYERQKENYQDYLDTQEKIRKKEEEIENADGAKFARKEQMNAELEALEDQADDIITDYYAREQRMRDNMDKLSITQKIKLTALNTDMVEAINTAYGSNDVQTSAPPPPPPLPILAPLIPLTQTYVHAGMKITCPFSGGVQVPFMVTPEKRVLLDGTPMANIMDNKPITNIPPIGLCTNPANPAVAATAPAFTPKPCLIAPAGPWSPGKADVLVGGQPALLNTDRLQCSYGGIVIFVPEPPSPPSAGKNPVKTIVQNKLKNVPKDVMKKAAEKAVAKKASEKVTKKLVVKLLSKFGGFATGAIYSAGEFAYKKAKGEKFQDPLGFGDYLRKQGAPDGVADFGSHVVSDTAETGKAVVEIVDGHNQRLKDAGMEFGSPAHVRWMAARH